MTSSSVVDAGNLASDSGRITLSGFSMRDGYMPSVVAHNTLPAFGSGDGIHASVVAHNTLPVFGSGDGIYASVVAHNTLPAFGSGGTLQSLSFNHHVYKEASTNPLPSGNGFVGAPLIARLQHGHVTPLPKEKLHHG